MQLKQKLQSALHHPAAGLVTILVVNTAIVVAGAVVAKKLDQKVEPTAAE